MTPSRLALIFVCLVACAGPARRTTDSTSDDGTTDAGSTGDTDGGSTSPASCVVPVADCTDLPKTQQLSQPCCPAYGIDACGAELFCAALDGRTEATCYPLGSRIAESQCDADDECSSGSCNLDACRCRSEAYQACDPTVGCTSGWGCDTTGATPQCEENRLSGQAVSWAAVISRDLTDETGSYALIEWSTAANDCQPAAPSNAKFLDVEFGIQNSDGTTTAATSPGTFTVYPPGSTIPTGTNAAYAFLVSSDAQCQFTTQQAAESGTITLTGVDHGSYAGYYSIRFPNGTVSDTFHSTRCDETPTNSCD